jgi:hypothetical protein
LQEFLLGHAPLLRTLGLIDCYCPDSYNAFHSFANSFVARVLRLTGIEIYGLLFQDSIYHLERGDKSPHLKEYRLMRQGDEIYDCEIHGMRPNTRAWDTKALRNRGISSDMDMVSGWPYERPELEYAMLGGRSNNIVRRMHTAPDRIARDHWYDVPVSYP